jgi:hypothetical protein
MQNAEHKTNECGEFDCVKNEFGICRIGSCPEMEAVRSMLREEEKKSNG